MRKATYPLLLTISAASVLAPAPAYGQLFKRAKEMAARRAAEAGVERIAKPRDAQAGSIDSMLQRGATRSDTATYTATIARLSAELTAGRTGLDTLRFSEGDHLDAASEATLRLVARALNGTTGGFLVSVRISAPTVGQREADARAAAIRASLVSAGVDAGRLFSAGYASKSAVRSERAELLRIK